MKSPRQYSLGPREGQVFFSRGPQFVCATVVSSRAVGTGWVHDVLVEGQVYQLAEQLGPWLDDPQDDRYVRIV